MRGRSARPQALVPLLLFLVSAFLVCGNVVARDDLLCHHARQITGPLTTSIVPPRRCSTKSRPDLLLTFDAGPHLPHEVDLLVTASSVADGSPQKQLTLLKTWFLGNAGRKLHSFRLDLSVLEAANLIGDVQISVNVTDPKERVAYATRFCYEIVRSDVKGTRLLDSAFIDLLHWSDWEATHYPNSKLLELTTKDWREQLRFMAEAGISTAILQATFLNNAYLRHDENLTCSNYNGLSLGWKSVSYPLNHPGFVDEHDKVEAILQAADELGIDVFVGVGNFAWFDFRKHALCWSKIVATELYHRYSHHPSFYGLYATGEMAGDFFIFTDYYYLNLVADVATFFKTLREFVRTEMDPVLPILLACSSLRWDKHVLAWERVLPNVDILTPFGFSRTDGDWNTLPTILATAAKTNTRIWVDMEVFSTIPLVPKNTSALIAELEYYKDVESTIAYEFTGLMDSPESRLHLGGDAARVLYEGYLAYYRMQLPQMKRGRT